MLFGVFEFGLGDDIGVRASGSTGSLIVVSVFSCTSQVPIETVHTATNPARVAETA